MASSYFVRLRGKHASSPVDVDDDCHGRVIIQLILPWNTTMVSDEGMKNSHTHAIRKRASTAAASDRFC